VHVDHHPIGAERIDDPLELADHRRVSGATIVSAGK
jgi:hypothetical protein